MTLDGVTIRAVSDVYEANEGDLSVNETQFDYVAGACQCMSCQVHKKWLHNGVEDFFCLLRSALIDRIGKKAGTQGTTNNTRVEVHESVSIISDFMSFLSICKFLFSSHGIGYCNVVGGGGGGEGLETDANKKKFFFFHERTWRFVAIRFRFFDGVSLSCSTVTTISYGRDLRESRTNNQ